MHFGGLLALILAGSLSLVPNANCKTAYVDNSQELLVLAGRISSSEGKGIKDVNLSFWLNGEKITREDRVRTSSDGTFKFIIPVPNGKLDETGIELEATRHSYRSPLRVSPVRIVSLSEDPHGRPMKLAWFDVTLQRTITPGLWVAAFVLLCVYGVIAFELLHRTLAALLGASVMLIVTYTLGVVDHHWAILSFEEASEAIDMNVILLLMAMMIIVGVLKKTGVFQWIAYKAFQTAKGNISTLAIMLMFITSFISAFLDNVTTMLLIFPVAFQICKTLKINPVAILLPCAFSSNIGGTATLIGDPPNIMIGSYAKLTFMDFVRNLTPVCLAAQIACTLYFLVWYRSDYRTKETRLDEAMMERLRRDCQIADRSLMTKALLVLASTIFLFLVHGALDMEPSVAALIGAGVLMVISKANIAELLEKEVEWSTLIFFMMLFVVVGGAEHTGLIQIVAEWVREVSKESIVVAVLVILWVSALLSAVIDNIPFTATMLPIVSHLSQTIPGAEAGVLWWALSLGACLGGNGTMIGASANVVTVGMLEKAGSPVSFGYYLKIAFPPMLMTVGICTIWLLVFAK